MALRVAVVTDDEWRRRGLVDGLDELGGIIERPTGLPVHEVAHTDWSQIDAALLIADTPCDPWDQFRALAALPFARLSGHPTLHLTVIADDLSNPLLPLRAAEAGADALLPSTSLKDLETLETAVLLPSTGNQPWRLSDHRRLADLGVSTGARPGACLQWIEDQGLTEAFRSERHGLSRRRAITIRSKVMELTGMHPVTALRGGDSVARVPSWSQIHRFVATSRGRLPSVQWS